MAARPAKRMKMTKAGVGTPGQLFIRPPQTRLTPHVAMAGRTAKGTKDMDGG
jgi:hypothetical protein